MLILQHSLLNYFVVHARSEYKSSERIYHNIIICSPKNAYSMLTQESMLHWNAFHYQGCAIQGVRLSIWRAVIGQFQVRKSAVRTSSSHNFVLFPEKSTKLYNNISLASIVRSVRQVWILVFFFLVFMACALRAFAIKGRENNWVHNLSTDLALG